MKTPDNLADWLRVIRAEYREVPGLHLTKPQVQRLWSLEEPLCDVVLNALVDSRFLTKTSKDAYVLASRAV